MTVLGLLLLVAPARAAEIPKFKLTITVVDAKQKFVGGAMVSITHDTFGPEIRPYDYRIETNANGVATAEVLVGVGRWGEGWLYWPTLDIQVNKGSQTGKDRVKVPGNRFTTGVRYPEEVRRTVVINRVDEANEVPIINVEVSVTDEESKPVEGANVLIKDSASGGMGGERYSGKTGQDGKVTIPIQFTLKKTYTIEVSRPGYASGSKMLPLDKDAAGQTVRPDVVTLKKTAKVEGVDVTINVKREGGELPVVDAHITFVGVSGTAMGVYKTTTDNSGQAPLRIPGYGRFDVTISQDTYELFPKTQVQIDYGEEQKTLTFFMKEKPTGDETVDITVLAGDVKNGQGGYEPLKGATVRIGQTSTITDAQGKASVNAKAGIVESTQAQAFIEAVSVTVSANGYKSLSRSVEIQRKGPNQSGSASTTFVLQPGEDEVSDTTPLGLIVVVSDLLGNLVAGADVDFSSNGTLLWTHPTNAAGECDFGSKDRADLDISILRQGITVKVKHPGFKEHESLVSAKLLEPANAARRYSVQLEKDWGDLAQAIAALEGRVAAWNNDVHAVSAKLGSVDKLADKMPAAQGRVESLLEELKAAQKAFKAKLSGTSCEDAAKLRESIQSLQTEASKEEEKLNKALEEASALAARCTTKAEGETIAAQYRSALQLVGKIGAAGEKAAAANRDLARMAEAMKDGDTLLRQLDQTVEKIGNELSTAKNDTATAQSNFNEAFLLSKGVTGRRAALTGELEKLRTDYEVGKYYSSIPRDLTKRLDNLGQLLGSYNNDVSFGKLPDSGKLDEVIDTVIRIEGYKVEADGIVASFKGAMCSVQLMDDAVEEIRTRVTNASFELGLAADLPAKAQTCDEVTVPDVSRLSDPAAMKAAAGPNMVGMLVATNQAPPAGTKKLFSYQDPLANTKAKRGALLRIYLYQALADPAAALPSASVSPPEDLVVVPSVAGAESIEYMRIILDQAGFKSAFRSVTPKKKEDELKFAGQDPPAGEKRKSGSLVVVYINQKFQAPTATVTPTPAELAAASPSPSVSVSVSPSPSASSSGTPGTMPDLIGLTLEQAMTKMRSNMRIGGDEIGDKPPTPEKAMTIFSQTPAAGVKIASDKQVVVTIKRYGSAKEGPAVSKASSFEGTWEGLSPFSAQGKQETAVTKITRSGTGYLVDARKKDAGKGLVVPGHLENGKLVFVIEIDLGDLVGLSLGGAKLTEHKKDESGIMRYTFTCTVKGNDLPFGLDMKMPDDKDPKGKMYHFPEAGVWHRVQ